MYLIMESYVRYAWYEQHIGTTSINVYFLNTVEQVRIAYLRIHEHSYVEIGVAHPSCCFLEIGDSPQNNLRIQIVWNSCYILRLYG